MPSPPAPPCTLANLESRRFGDTWPIECAGVTLTLDQEVANFNNADLTGGHFEGFKLETDVERGLVNTLDRDFYCRIRGLDEPRLRLRLYVGREKVGGRVMVDRAPRATPRPLPLGALTPVAFRPSMRTMTPPPAGTLSESRAP